VRENIEDFEAFQLSARYLEGVFWRNAVLVEALQARSLTKEFASRLIILIATRDRQLLSDLEKDWDAGRPADSVVKLEQVDLERPTDQLLFHFKKAAEFSENLARDPGRAYILLTSVPAEA
jgi:hypothetical protein